MNVKLKSVSGLIIASLTVFASCGYAETPTKNDKSLDQIKASITAGIKVARASIEISGVAESPLPGIYKVSIAGAKDIYATADGKHFITGDIIAVRPGEFVNLTDLDRNVDRQKAIAGIDKKELITFSPKGEVKKKMYVFTDVDCGYCQLLHSKVAEYNDMGIEVSYLGYPRAGINSGSFNKLASAWCSDNPREALTKLKKNETIPENICATNPIEKQYNLGQEFGLTGTPALILESGELISGYIPPESMKQRLNL